MVQSINPTIFPSPIPPPQLVRAVISVLLVYIYTSSLGKYRKYITFAHKYEDKKLAWIQKRRKMTRDGERLSNFRKKKYF